MAFSQADLDNIRGCIASGVLHTRFADGREVRYQTIADMLKAEQLIAGAVNGAVPSATPRRRVAAYRNGF
jgi:hypothetical protein